jgi:hypothetical protein
MTAQKLLTWLAHDHPADLFGWKPDGRIPDVAIQIIRRQGPERIARELIDSWADEALAKGRRTKRRPAEAAKRLSEWTYLLVSFYAQEGAALPPVILKLLQVALGVVISPTGDVSPRSSLTEFGAISGVDRHNVERFMRTAQLDAEYIDAYGEPASDRLLSRSLVERFNLAYYGHEPDLRATVRAWRSNRAYVPLRDHYLRMRRALFG